MPANYYLKAFYYKVLREAAEPLRSFILPPYTSVREQPLTSRFAASVLSVCAFLIF